MSEPQGFLGSLKAKLNGEAEPAEPLPEVQKVRRRLIVGSIVGFLGIDLLMFLRFFFPRALFEPNTIFTVGYPSDFAFGVDQRFLQLARIWVVRDSEGIFAIFAKCTHLGCTPDWKPQENKFKCPCHGSGYDSEGINFEGPAPRPMDRAHIAVAPNGEIVVDTSRLYKRDPASGLDQFEDPGAMLRGV